MQPISYKRHRFPAEVIRQAVWLYFRFSLSLRDVEELMAARGVEVSYETIRCWTIKFGPAIARNLRRAHPLPSPRWHLDEMPAEPVAMRRTHSRWVVITPTSPPRFTLTPAGQTFASDASYAPPYPGAKPCMLIDPERWDDAAWLSELFRVSAPGLPAPKTKTKRTP